MILNQSTDYGFRIVLHLAKQLDNVRIEAQEISKAQIIPERFLFKIMGNLVKAGIVKSFRGAKGGFTLARKTEDISLLDVVEAIEGPVLINCCLDNKELCTRNAGSYCVIHQELEELKDFVVKRLGEVNFKYIVEKEYKSNLL